MKRAIESVFGMFAVVLAALAMCWYLIRPAIPKNNLKIEDHMMSVKKWRVVGPFVLGAEFDYTYTHQSEMDALGHDYLRSIGGSESPLRITRPSTNISIDFTRNVDDDVPISNSADIFIDQAVEFPLGTLSSKYLFWGFPRRWGITYSAANLISSSTRDIYFIVASNSPLKIWLNGSIVATPFPGSTGHNWADRYILQAHLNKGKNTLLVKMFSFPGRNDFNIRVATKQQMVKYLEQNAFLGDIVERVIVPQGEALRLTDAARDFVLRGGTGRIVVTDQSGLVITQLSSDQNGYISTKGWKQGIYDVSAVFGNETRSELIFVGDIATRVDWHVSRCGNVSPEKQIQYNCAVAIPLQKRLPSNQNMSRLDKDKYILLLLSQLEWTNNDARVTPGFHKNNPRISLIQYRSGVDKTQQYYYLHLPPNYVPGKSVPLVVICPYNHGKPNLFDEVPTSQALSFESYSLFADKFGFAFMVPFERGLGMTSSIGMQTVIEAIDDAQRRFRIDANKMFLTGDCAGGEGALLLGEQQHKRFAAISTLNAATGVDIEKNRSKDRLFEELGSLSKTPIQLIHGNDFPHSPIQQAYLLKTACNRIGIWPELVVIPGNGTFGEIDPIWLSFNFFQKVANKQSQYK